jgi:hypothetical protein
MRCALSRETRCGINGVGRSNLKGIDMNPQLILSYERAYCQRYLRVIEGSLTVQGRGHGAERALQDRLIGTSSPPEALRFVSKSVDG